MPNWCECDLYIDGPRERVTAFLDAVKTEDSIFDFNRIIPYPERFADLDRIAAEWEQLPPERRTGARPKDGYNQGGYDWCQENWGTKWRARDAALGYSSCDPEDSLATSRSVEINFRTPWCAPAPVVLRASELYPDLDFDLRYFERGMAFNGVYRCKAGKALEDECAKYFGNRGG